jgi:hypothetical protein
VNAGAYGMQISYVRHVKLYRAAERKIEILKAIKFRLNPVTLLLRLMI